MFGNYYFGYYFGDNYFNPGGTISSGSALPLPLQPRAVAVVLWKS